LTGPVRQTFLLLVGAAACVLLIAALNLAGLQVARSLQRGREMQIRLSLGASRSRLVRLLVVESVVLALVGGFAGLVGRDRDDRQACGRSHRRWCGRPRRCCRARQVLTFTCAAVGGLRRYRRRAAGVARRPAARLAGGANPRRHAGSAPGRARGRRWCRCKVGVTVVLLIVASLVSISLLRVLRVNPGFD
jgi:hypothetical protein